MGRRSSLFLFIHSPILGSMDYFAAVKQTLLTSCDPTSTAEKGLSAVYTQCCTCSKLVLARLSRSPGMMNRASRSYGPVELRSAAGVLPLVRLTLAHRDGMEGMATRLAGLQSVWKSRQPLCSGSFRRRALCLDKTQVRLFR